MKKILLFCLIFSLLGCSKYDKVQAGHSCEYKAVQKYKLQDSENKKEFIFACMQESGYKYSGWGNSTCSDFSFSDECWEYTWRVFLQLVGWMSVALSAVWQLACFTYRRASFFCSRKRKKPKKITPCYRLFLSVLAQRWGGCGTRAFSTQTVLAAYHLLA